MITDRFFSSTDGGVTFQTAPEWVELNGANHRVADLAARQEWSNLIAANPPTYREWMEPGDPWLGYDPHVLQANPEPEDDIAVAARYLAGTEAERRAAQRESIRTTIEQVRASADVSNIDLRADAGRQVLMDESNSQAETKLNELAATDDADLDAFDSAFDPLQIGSVATASSLFLQTERVLATDPTLDAQQVADLETLRVQYGQIVSDGNDGAPVPVPTDNVRLKLGVVAEGFGSLEAQRVENGGFWWIRFEVRTRRELSVDDYWIAVYQEDGTYLSAPRLEQVGNGNGTNIYRSVDTLARPAPELFMYALCHQHISNQQFDPLTIAADVNERIDPIRWGGNAS